VKAMPIESEAFDEGLHTNFSEKPLRSAVHLQLQLTLTAQAQATDTNLVLSTSCSKTSLK